MQTPLVTLMTNELEASKNFYKNILDFKEDCLKEFPQVTLLFMHHEYFTLELVERKEKVPLVAGNTFILTFTTDSFEEIKARLKKENHPLPSEIKLPSGVEMLRFPDPNGITISFVKPNSAHS